MHRLLAVNMQARLRAVKDFWVYRKGSTDGAGWGSSQLRRFNLQDRRLLGLMRGYGDCHEGWPGTPSSPGDWGVHVQGQ